MPCKSSGNPSNPIYDSIADLGEIEVYLGSKFQSCFIDDFGMSGSLLQYWKYVKQI